MSRCQDRMRLAWLLTNARLASLHTCVPRGLHALPVGLAYQLRTPTKSAMIIQTWVSHLRPKASPLDHPALLVSCYEPHGCSSHLQDPNKNREEKFPDTLIRIGYMEIHHPHPARRVPQACFTEIPSLVNSLVSTPLSTSRV